MSKTLCLYSQTFCNLQEEIACGIPPRKAILLLGVIELFEHRLLQNNQIFLSTELIAAFLKYWNHLGLTSHRADIALTFFNMNSEQFWNLKAKPGFEEVIYSKGKEYLITIEAIKKAIQYAYLDTKTFSILQDPTSRKYIFKSIVKKCFINRANELQELLKINTLKQYEEKFSIKGGLIYNSEDLKNEEKTIVREAVFSRVVSSLYHYQCAFCGLQAINSLSQTIVDGVHIKPFSFFYDDRIDNGISLCKNHGWAFEHGWFTVDENYKIIISNDLWIKSPYVKSMLDFQGQRILLPPQKQYFPRIEALRWHLENVFNRFAG
jgi:putative restriction endonuclease